MMPLKPLVVAALVMASLPASAQQAISVFAAGSLREALTAIARDYEAKSGDKITLTFGASGLLRERIEKGEGAQVFASADTGHPRTLAQKGGWAMPAVFTRNTLCGLTQANVAATPGTLLETMLNPATRLAASTPKSDPSGDYAWALFKKADALKPGAYAALDAKAMKLVGAADSPQAPPGRTVYGWLMDEGKADVFLIYCTNALAAQKEVPRLKIVGVPPELLVGAAYGLTVKQDAPVAAWRFAWHVLSPDGQAAFARFGFGRVDE